MEKIILAGLALMLVFEGIMPFAAPQSWRETFQRIIALTDGQLRLAGLLSMLAGLTLLTFLI